MGWFNLYTKQINLCVIDLDLLITIIAHDTKNVYVYDREIRKEIESRKQVFLTFQIPCFETSQLAIYTISWQSCAEFPFWGNGDQISAHNEDSSAEFRLLLMRFAAPSLHLYDCFICFFPECMQRIHICWRISCLQSVRPPFLRLISGTVLRCKEDDE